MAASIAKNIRFMQCLKKNGIILVQARSMGGGGQGPNYLPIKVDIGKREVVGFGMNGEEVYIDSTMFPFPAIRFKEETAEIAMLREKEKGDWKKLTIEEKKALYRYSFCQTIAEHDAPTGVWKSIVGITLMLVSLGIWGFIWTKAFVYEPLPETITNPELVKARADRMIALRVNPIEGFSSKYDYEKGEWKE